MYIYIYIYIYIHTHISAAERRCLKPRLLDAGRRRAATMALDVNELIKKYIIHIYIYIYICMYAYIYIYIKHTHVLYYSIV